MAAIISNEELLLNIAEDREIIELLSKVRTTTNPDLKAVYLMKIRALKEQLTKAFVQINFEEADKASKELGRNR